MAKAKNKKPFNKHGAPSSQPDPKKRKMQHFDRVSKSSTTSTSTSNPAKKAKFNEPNATSPVANSKKRNSQHQQEFHQRPTIPYQRKDRILLVGEGDFSFARSLAEHHRCKRVLASCYDSKDVLVGKYAEKVEANIKAFLQVGRKRGSADKNGASSSQDKKSDDAENSNTIPKVLFSVDARKLGTPTGGGKEIRQGIKQKKQTGGPWDIISFNFPHIGGKSTDVNRQVRANQELLVAFFKACVPLLSTSTESKEDDDDEEIGYGTDSDDSSHYHTDSEEDDDDESASDNDVDKSQKAKEIRTVPRQSGQIIVTIFEGEPYTLWNIKDLARHAGLTVVTSFRFPWKSYPGYAHARTLGIVESRHGGKTGGGWKGEDRDARTYVFEVKQENHGHHHQSNAGKKKKKKDEDSSDEDD